MFQKLKKDKRALTGILIGMVVLLAMMAILLPIGLYLTVTMEDTIADLSLPTAENATAESMFDNIKSSYSLAAVVPIIAGAGVVIAAIVTGFAYYGRTRR